MIQLLLTDWRNTLIGLLLISNIIITGLWRYEVNSFITYSNEVALQAQIAQEQTKRIISEQKQVTEDTTNGWKAALDTIRSTYAKRMLNNGIQPMPGLSRATYDVNGIPTDAMALASDCAETTLQLVKLQEWVIKQKALK